MDESRSLLEALFYRAASADERRRIELAWRDYEIARARGESTTFADLLVRRRIASRDDVIALLANKSSPASGSGSNTDLIGERKRKRGAQPIHIFLIATGIVVLVSGALLVQAPAPAPPPPSAADLESEKLRRETFAHQLDTALKEGIGGNTDGAEKMLRLAGDLARTPAELARIDAVKAKINEANARPVLPDAPPPSPPKPVSPTLPVPSPSSTPPPPPPGPGSTLEPAPLAKAPPPPPRPTPVVVKLEPDEEQALAYGASQLLELSRFCTKNKAYREARIELELALVLAPEDKAVKQELGAVEELASDPTKFFRENFARERGNAHLRAANRLGDLALAYKKAGDKERWLRWVDAIEEYFPGETTEKALKRVGLVYFEPYLDWLEPADWKRLDGGSELVNGEWRDKAHVAELNRRHATWSDPWVLTDGVHELKTTVSLRLARKLLAQVSAYRRFFLKQFSRAWDLRPPAGKLPVILCRNQEDYRERIDAESKRMALRIVPPRNAAAFYLVVDRPLNPCFVTLEAQSLEGNLLKFGWDNVLLVLKHELTHQIATEYSRHDAAKSEGLPEKNFWVIEALASFMCFYEIDRGHWHLTRPRTTPTRTEGVNAVSPFAWCLEHIDQLPRLADYFNVPPDEFMTEECYHMATCVAYFLLFGERRKYRAGFIELCERVHKHRADEKTFDECFPGVDKAQLNRQFIRFVSGIALDE